MVLREMRRRGVPPNGRTCAALLEACLSAGRPQAGEALAAEMRSAGVDPRYLGDEHWARGWGKHFEHLRGAHHAHTGQAEDDQRLQGGALEAQG